MRVDSTPQRFQVFVQDLQESFWGDFQGRTREMLKKLLEADAEQPMADDLGLKWYERTAEEQPRTAYRNGFYERDDVTPLGVIRLRIPRTRPMVVFTNVGSVDRIIYAIFSRFNEDWKNHTLALFTQAA